MSRQVTSCNAQGVTPVGCAEGETVRRLAPCLRFCRRSMPNGSHKEESPGGWTDHSYCPWLSRLSRSVPRSSVTTLTVVAIKHAHCMITAAACVREVRL